MNEIPFLEGGELPAIHYCAVQSTQHCEERGFRKRNGKDQFRLAELTEDGKIQPMDIKRNVIFRSPEELKDLVPSMYEEIPYRELLKKQEELQKQAVVSSMAPETQEEIQTETAGVALEMPVEEPPTRIVRKHPVKTAGLSTARKEIRKQEMAEAGIA